MGEPGAFALYSPVLREGKQGSTQVSRYEFISSGGFALR